MSESAAPAIESVEAAAFTIPTEQPEQDGTLEWDQTTLLLMVARAGDSAGIGYSYCHPAAAEVVNGKLAEVVRGHDPMRVGESWAAMGRAVRNFGQAGLPCARVPTRWRGRGGTWIVLTLATCRRAS